MGISLGLLACLAIFVLCKYKMHVYPALMALDSLCQILSNGYVYQSDGRPMTFVYCSDQYQHTYCCVRNVRFMFVLVQIPLRVKYPQWCGYL